MSLKFSSYFVWFFFCLNTSSFSSSHWPNSFFDVIATFPLIFSAKISCFDVTDEIIWDCW